MDAKGIETVRRDNCLMVRARAARATERNDDRPTDDDDDDDDYDDDKRWQVSNIVKECLRLILLERDVGARRAVAARRR